jgi:signal transduction histidine kinase
MFVRNLTAIFLIVSSIISTDLFATPAKLHTTPDFYLPLIEYTQTFVDESAELKLENIISNPDYFERIKTPYIDFGSVLKGQGWLKVSLLNDTDDNGVWRLDINRQYYYSLNVYTLREGKVEQILRHASSDSYYDRPVNDRMLGVDIEFSPGEIVDIYMAVKSKASTFMPLGVGTMEATARFHNKEHTVNWLINGVLFTFIGFAVLLISVIGWRLSLSFSLYILAGFAYMFHADGYTFVYFWPNHMDINDSMGLSFLVMMPFFGLVFSRSLFDFKKHAPKFENLLICYFFIAGAVALFSAHILENQTLKVLAYLVPPLGSFGQFVAGIIGLRKNLLGAKAYFVGAFVVVIGFIYAVMAHTFRGHFDHDMTLDFGHFALVIEGLAFIAAIAARLVGIRDERDRALESQLATVQDKLRLSTELKKAQDDFIRARRVADKRRNQLSSVSHDLQQPLLSLRNALSRMSGSDEDAAQQMHSAFDYLESLAREQLGVDQNQETEHAINSSIERFPVNIVLDNVREMFADEAASKGIELRFKPITIEVQTDPVALMRSLSNLVSNAIKHSRCNVVLLAARRRGKRLRIEVWDNGEGMSDKDFSNYIKRHKKGSTSQGSGLGLSIVKSISDEYRLDFEMRFGQGEGTVAFLYLPTNNLNEGLLS